MNYDNDNNETCNTKDIKTKERYYLICVNYTSNCPMPNNAISLDMGKERSRLALEEAKKNNISNIVLSMLIDGEINPVAIVTQVNKISRIARDIYRFEGECKKRVKISKYIQSDPFYIVEVEDLETEKLSNDLAKVYLNKIKEIGYDFKDRRTYINILNFDSERTNEELQFYCDKIMGDDLTPVKDKIAYINETDEMKRADICIKTVVSKSKIKEIDEHISEIIRTNMDKSQKEYILREKIKAISEELGEDASEMDKYEESIEKLNVKDEIKEKLQRDLKRLRKLSSQSPDASILRNYLDTILSLPWNDYTTDNLDLLEARKILDEDHSGLEKIKDRIIEYLACMKLTGKLNGQIICLAGPPGVGKTSIAKSIARALGRKYVRMSLGGIKDEAEIRGHRKTYIGAMPGRIIYNMRLAKKSNPLFLIDEIDKLGSDYKGDPSSAMLEVLDPEQNFEFRDNFLEVPYDLSQVLFIATANDISSIPGPLRDRMEIIELPSYTASEKFTIAKEHLVKKELEKNGLLDKNVTITDDAIKYIIDQYTYESGVRNLERKIGTILRKCTVKILNDDVEKIVIDKDDLKEMLGAPKGNRDKKRLSDEVGVVSGLYYTPLGGGILNIEVSTVDGKGDIKVTGQIGDVMKESSQIAITVMKNIGTNYGIEIDKIKDKDIHIHIPDGATKKEGPSAGLALTTALVSQFSGKKVYCNLAMTGEIGLRGEALPIGGLREKLFACVRSGIEKVIVPELNKDDIDELPKEIKDNLEIHYVKDISEVLNIALV